MKVIEGKDLFDYIHKYDYVLLGVNINHSMANGLARDIALNYPHVHEMNLKTPYSDLRKMGTILECSKEGEPSVILLFITKGYSKKEDDYLDYDALEKCLRLINIRYKQAKVCCPIIGGGRFDGNGDKDKILSMIDGILSDLDITVYDYEQLSRDEKYRQRVAYEQSIKEQSQRRYNHIVRKRKQKEREIKNKNGRAKY